MNINIVRNAMIKRATGPDTYTNPYSQQYPFEQPKQGQKFRHYFAQPEESYESIAKRTNTPMGTLIQLNNVRDLNQFDRSKPLIVYDNYQPQTKYRISPGAKRYITDAFDNNKWNQWGITKPKWMGVRGAWDNLPDYVTPAIPDNPWNYKYTGYLLDTIRGVESTEGKNLYSLDPNSTARGEYGMNAGAYSDFARWYPQLAKDAKGNIRPFDDIVRDPAYARTAAGAYLDHEIGRFKERYPDIEFIPAYGLGIWNQGLGGVFIPQTIKVKAGNTLGGIAKKYGMTVDELQRLNGIKDPSVLSVGQTIKLY